MQVHYIKPGINGSTNPLMAAVMRRLNLFSLTRHFPPYFLYPKEAFAWTSEATAGLYRGSNFQRKNGLVPFQDFIRSVRSVTV